MTTVVVGIGAEARREAPRRGDRVARCVQFVTRCSAVNDVGAEPRSRTAGPITAALIALALMTGLAGCDPQAPPIGACAEVVCAASDQCHDVGACDPQTGNCSNPAKMNNTACNDGNGCTQSDTCQRGV